MLYTHYPANVAPFFCKEILCILQMCPLFPSMVVQERNIELGWDRTGWGEGSYCLWKTMLGSSQKPRLLCAKRMLHGQKSPGELGSEGVPSSLLPRDLMETPVQLLCWWDQRGTSHSPGHYLPQPEAVGILLYIQVLVKIT